MTNPTVDTFVADLKAATAGISDPAEALKIATPLMERMAADISWVKPEYYVCDEEQGFGITILNEDDDHSYLVEAICWLPGRGVAPHDHQSWGIVVGLDGVETNTDWARNDDGSKEGFADIEKARETAVELGTVVSFLPDDIHSVRNSGETPSLSLHVYGVAPSSLSRSEFDPINKTQQLCPQRKRTKA